MWFLNIARWPAILVFILAGIAAISFAFVTVNLFSQAMANIGFLRSAGFEAIRHGALRQACELIVWGGVALTCWMIFKFCEQELQLRYRHWSKRHRK
jgi:hypothetical protein